MRTHSKILFFLVGILYFFLLDGLIATNTLLNAGNRSIARIESQEIRIRVKLDGAFSYRQLPNGEYRILEIINSDEGVILIRQIMFTTEIDFLVTGVPREWLHAKTIKIAWA